VIDASALVAVIFREPGAEAVVARLDNARLIAPALLDVELVSASLKKLRKNDQQKAEIIELFLSRNQIRWERRSVDHEAVFSLAIATGLSAYDASYLWLAETENAELVTLDQKLAAAFARSPSIRPAP
jgi:predicted nucleic acid-binding protein